jgi:iron complex transport system ATP-binding protein
MVEIKNGGYAVGDKWLVRNVNCIFEPGKCYMLCGPNGAGKSTLLKLLSLDYAATEGTVYYNNKLADRKTRREHASYRAVLSQQVEISFPLLVEEVVMMGRYPHFSVSPNRNDLQVCETVMTKLDILHLAKRNFPTLSGGEKQRVQFARVLAQIWDPPSEHGRILLLDEPISSLDLKQQFDFLGHVRDLLDGKTVVIAILHDLNLALNYADELLLMRGGQLYAKGKPAEILSPENIGEVFDLRTAVHNLEGINLLWPVSK